MRARACALAAFAVLASPAIARGDPPASGAPTDASNAAAAQALFDEAVKLMEAGRFAEACPKLAASENLDPGAGTLLDLGTCYEKNGQTASAWATFQEAEEAARRSSHDEWAERAHAHVTALEQRLQRLVVSVDTRAAVPGLVVLRDGVAVERGAWGLPIPMDPGHHVVRASAPGKRDWSTTVDLTAEGTSSTVTVPALEDLPPAPPPAPPVTAAAPDRPPPAFWSTQRGSGATLAAAGVVGLAVGSGLGLAAKSKYDAAVDDDCPGRGTQCTAAGVQQGQEAHALATASTVVFLTSGAAVAAGAVLFFVPLGGHSANAGAAALRMMPVVAPGTASLALRGTW